MVGHGNTGFEPSSTMLRGNAICGMHLLHAMLRFKVLSDVANEKSKEIQLGTGDWSDSQERVNNK